MDIYIDPLVKSELAKLTSEEKKSEDKQRAIYRAMMTKFAIDSKTKKFKITSFFFFFFFFFYDGISVNAIAIRNTTKAVITMATM
jgi:hypothetical protein